MAFYITRQAPEAQERGDSSQDPPSQPRVPEGSLDKGLAVRKSMGLSQNRFLLLLQPGPSLAPTHLCLLPAAPPAPARAMPGLFEPLFQDPSGLFRPRLPGFPKPGPSLGRAFSGLLWVSHGQTVNNSTEHWLYHQGPGTRPSRAGGI